MTLDQQFHSDQKTLTKRELQKKYHPDKHPGQEDIFTRLFKKIGWVAPKKPTFTRPAPRPQAEAPKSSSNGGKTYYWQYKEDEQPSEVKSGKDGVYSTTYQNGQTIHRTRDGNAKKSYRYFDGENWVNFSADDYLSKVASRAKGKEEIEKESAELEGYQWETRHKYHNPMWSMNFKKIKDYYSANNLEFLLSRSHYFTNNIKFEDSLFGDPYVNRCDFELYDFLHKTSNWKKWQRPKWQDETPQVQKDEAKLSYKQQSEQLANNILRLDKYIAALKRSKKSINAEVQGL